MTNGPGKAHRQGISIFELTERFPTETAAETWFERMRWGDHRYCPHCGNANSKETKNRKPMPFWCGDCRSYFSVRTGTPLQHSRLPLRKWIFAIYLYVTSLKGVSSLKLHRDLKVTQKTAWFMLHRLRKAWSVAGLDTMKGPIEVDETFVGGKRKNMHRSKRKQLAGAGPAAGKSIIIGAKDRATKRVRANVVTTIHRGTLHRFVMMVADDDTVLYTDGASGYDRIRNPHETVRHSRGEYVRGDVHTNGIESFWSMFKRAHTGTYHYMSGKHMQAYVDEFAGRAGIREWGTNSQMVDLFTAMVGKQLTYKDLIAED